MKVDVYKINGAAVFPEIIKIGENYIMPEINPEYRWAFTDKDGKEWVSKDAMHFVLAIKVEK